MPPYYHDEQNEAKFHTILLTGIFTVLALSLWLQPNRFENTPAYGNLLDVLHSTQWAFLYAVAALFAIVCGTLKVPRGLRYVSHTISIVLLSSWWIAFIIRWATDSGTTPVNVLSWGVFLYLAVRNALLMDALGSRGNL